MDTLLWSLNSSYHAHLAPVEVELQHLVAAVQGTAGHQPQRALGVHLLQFDTVCPCCLPLVLLELVLLAIA